MEPSKPAESGDQETEVALPKEGDIVAGKYEERRLRDAVRCSCAERQGERRRGRFQRRGGGAAACNLGPAAPPTSAPVAPPPSAAPAPAPQ